MTPSQAEELLCTTWWILATQLRGFWRLMCVGMGVVCFLAALFRH